MAYVPEFKHDIFISYARADDAMDPQGVQWVSDFQVYLRRTVKQHLYGNEPAVFFDALDLDPNQPIQTVLANARQSAVFLPVISPSYVARRWPNDELNAFSEEVGEQGRIFAIELLPVPDELPLPLRNLRRKEFWWKDEKQGSAPRKFTPKYRSDKYTDYLEDVAYLVAKRLRAMHPEGDTQARNASSVAGKPVLLAEVTDDLRRVRRQVREYLEQFGVNVRPQQDYPDAPLEFIAAFNADLAEADAFVQLLSEVRSAKWPKFADDANRESESQGQYQYDAAERKGIPVLQWRHPNVDASTVTHWDQRLLSGPHVLVMGLQEFMKEIRKKLEQPAPQAAAPRAAGGRLVFINADSSDQELTQRLLKAFENDPDLLAQASLFKGSPDRILKDLEDNLKACAALLVVYGNSEPEWVRAQMRLYQKLEGLRTEAPRLKAILLGPPAPKSENDLGSAGGFKKMDYQHDATVERLQQIVAGLRT
jgi:hypothetical protein